MNRDELIRDLTRDEALIQRPYFDCCGKPFRRCQCKPQGKLTIGIGRNIEDNGITPGEAQQLCENDVRKVEAELDVRVPWWRNMSEPRQRALANMCFNLGWPKLSEFRQTLRLLNAGRYDEAADECLKSKWAQQVGERAQRIARAFRDGG